MEGAQAQLKLLRRAVRRRSLLVLLALLVLAAVLIVVLRPAAEEIRRASEALPEGRVDITARRLTTYEIHYRVDTLSGREIAMASEWVRVNRPFDAAISTSSIPKESEGDETQGFVVPDNIVGYALGRTLVREEVLAVPPDIPTGDRRPDSSLEEMVARGYADERERRRVADRVCRVFRIAGAADEIGLAPLRRAKGNYSDVCIDEAGLTLEEVTYKDGEITTQRFAASVDEKSEIDRDVDLGDPTIDAREGGGSFQEVNAESRLPGGDFWDLSQTPEGFKHRGRFAVVPPQPGLTDRTQAETILASMTDVYTNSIDVLLIDRSSTRGGNSPYDDDPNARKVDAGEIGRGELRYSLRMSEVRVRTATGRYVRVAGTLSGERLVSIARTLEPLPEGPLVPLKAD